MESSVQTDKIIVNETVKSAYEDMIFTVSDNFDNRIACITETCASVVATLMLEDISNCVGLILVDNPSTGKTTALSFFYDLPMAYRSDNFTPAAFVSQAANRKESALKKIDLLPRIQHQCLVVPEMATLFGQKPDDLTRSISVLTRIFDGEGYRTDSGTHGSRGYIGDYVFSMLGATTPLSKGAWKIMGQFGSRLLFQTLTSASSPKERMDKNFIDCFFKGRNNFKQRVANCRNAVTRLFRVLHAEYCKESFYKSVPWNIFSDPTEIRHQISTLAEFTSRARSYIAIWDRPSERTGKYDFANITLEGPQRLTALLFALARGHAIINGRKSLTSNDMAIVTEVALCSMPNDRRQVVDKLLDNPGTGKTSPRGCISSIEIGNALRVSRPTGIKIIEEFALLGIGEKKTGLGTPNTTYLELNPAYAWLTSDQLISYRHTWKQKDSSLS